MKVYFSVKIVFFILIDKDYHQMWALLLIFVGLWDIHKQKWAKFYLTSDKYEKLY